jgi:pimeloyl-ACP methyl ester carboxylesterase
VRDRSQSENSEPRVLRITRWWRQLSQRPAGGRTPTKRTLRPVLYQEVAGDGEAIVLVHGAWADARHWARLARELDGFRVVSYDRRGHGRSEGGHEGIDRHVADLAALVERTGSAGHVVGGSLGGSIALRLAAARPELLLSLSVHEPALPGLLGAAAPAPANTPSPEDFAAASLGAGAWERLTEDERDGFRDNAGAWRDEMADAEAFTIDPTALAAFHRPAMITLGSESPPHFARIADALAAALPDATVDVVPGAGHLPHLTHPREYAALLKKFASAAAARR